MRNRLIALAAAALMPLAAASAQETVVGPSNVLSLQPLTAMLTVYAAEYERQTATALTFGIGGTHWDLGDEDLKYTSGDLKLRYYPQGTPLRGFSLGGSVGYTSASATSLVDGSEETANGPSFGVLLEYQWLMGASRNFALALGLGAKAVMINEDEISSDDFIARYPTARVSVGWAF